jgi:hypothetical protein
MEIIIREKGTEAERRKREAAVQILKHYHGRECRDGARFRTKVPGGKNAIRRVYE